MKLARIYLSGFLVLLALGASFAVTDRFRGRLAGSLALGASLVLPALGENYPGLGQFFLIKHTTCNFLP